MSCHVGPNSARGFSLSDAIGPTWNVRSRLRTNSLSDVNFVTSRINLLFTPG